MPLCEKGLHRKLTGVDLVYVAENNTYRCPAGERQASRFASVEDGMALHVYWTSACPDCPLKAKCTTGKERRIKRWEHEGVLETMQARLDQAPEKMEVRRQTVEHPFGTIKAWMGSTHFLTKTLRRVSTEMSLHVLAYNLKRMMKVLGVVPLMQAMRHEGGDILGPQFALFAASAAHPEAGRKNIVPIGRGVASAFARALTSPLTKNLTSKTRP